MKAILLSQYGSPDKLTLSDVPTPQPKPGEVLIKVHATSINDIDWSMIRGKPHIYRLLFGISKPKFKIPGSEVAGIVEAVGSDVTRFNAGDRVYGDISESGFGGFAEYACINESALTIMPTGLSFEQAAATPHAAMLALQGLVDVGHIRQGERVLINGAGGGVGMFAVQIAKQYGCEVTGVDRGFKLDALNYLGFDKAIDYQKIDFTQNENSYDLILDAKSTRAPSRYLKALKPGGRYVTVGGHLPQLLQILFAGLALKILRLRTKRLQVLALKPNKGMAHINSLYEARGLKCLIDGPFTLEQIPKALEHFGKGDHIGKVVIKIV
jgi:NADPH:quinone reductase-like Zn-dependent oxidoreductase